MTIRDFFRRARRAAVAGATGTMAATCDSCGAVREVPADPKGRGPQWCNGCGGCILPASADHAPATPNGVTG